MAFLRIIFVEPQPINLTRKERNDEKKYFDTLSQGIMAVGACAVPVGVEGGTKRVLGFIKLTAPDGIFATPSFGQYLIEQCPKLIGKDASTLGMKWFFTAGEPGGENPEVRHAQRS